MSEGVPMTERHIPESRIALNPVVIDDSKREVPSEHPLVINHREMGWKLYVFTFCYTYTFFSIYLASYCWILSHVFGFKIVGCIFGWCP